MEIIFILGAFQSLFLSALLLTRKQNARANRFMGLWLIFLGMYFFDAWVVASGTYLKIPHLSGVFSGTPLVHGPFLMLYTLALIQPNRRFRAKWLLHFLPFLIYYVHGGLTFFSLSEPDKLDLMAALVEGNPPWDLFAWGVFKSLHGLTYLLVILWTLKRHRDRMQDQFSTLERVNLKWLSAIAWGLLGIYVFATINVGLVFLFEINLEGIMGFLAALFILGMAFMALRQGELFGPSNGVGSLSAVVVGADEGSYSGIFGAGIESGESDNKPGEHEKERPEENEEIVELKNRISQYLDTEQSYLEPDLSLGQLAEALEVHYKELSRAINEGFGVNFFTLINRYRLEAYKQELEKPRNQNLTLLGLAYKCGFNSKTTFNTVFKREVGMTPSQYKRSLSEAKDLT